MLILMALLLMSPTVGDDILNSGSASAQTDGPGAPAVAPVAIDTMVPGSDLYPPEAWQSSVRGTTTIALSLKAGETVPACRIETSSGSEALDARSCTLALSHQVFPRRQADQLIRQNWSWAIAGVPEDRDSAAIAISPVNWVVPDDYPGKALRLMHDGRVKADVEVSKRGTVRRCRTRISSGYAELDRATCSLLVRRARYLPARDAQGRPRATTDSYSFIWVHPGIPLPPGRVYMTTRLGDDASCTVEVTGETRRLKRPVCRALTENIMPGKSDDGEFQIEIDGPAEADYEPWG